jgi:hypothetical protein
MTRPEFDPTWDRFTNDQALNDQTLVEQTLVDFLRQHQPAIPSANPNLEAQIMAAIEACSAPKPTQKPINPQTDQRHQYHQRHTGPDPNRGRERRSFKAWQRWGIPSAIAAILLVAWLGIRPDADPTPVAATELAELESFLEETWGTTLHEDGEQDSDGDWVLGMWP